MRHTGKVQGAIAFLILVGFFGVLWALIYAHVEATGYRDALLIMVGSLGSMATGIVAYYFGSSTGSAAKTEMLARATQPAPLDAADAPGTPPWRSGAAADHQAGTR